MPFYHYDVDDMGILTTLAKVWDPPVSARPTRSDGRGNCINAALFALLTLQRLHVECEVAVMRVEAEVDGHLYTIGWGDCHSLEKRAKGLLGAHVVVIGRDWLFDPSIDQIDVVGPLVVSRVVSSHTYDKHPANSRPASMPCPCNWAYDTAHVSVEYTWAPGRVNDLMGDLYLCSTYGWNRAAARHAAEVRRALGPCRAPQVWEF